MTATYHDASTIVKVLLEEDRHQEAREIWEADTRRFGCRLVNVEVIAAVAAGTRNGRIPPAEIERARATTRRLLATVRPIELSQPIAEDAAALAERRALKGADAIHLACALALDGDLVFTTWDRRLHAAARAEGLRVAPASLD